MGARQGAFFVLYNFWNGCRVHDLEVKMIRNIIMAILVLVLTGCQSWREKGELTSKKLDALQRQDVKMLVGQHDVCGLYGRYITARTIVEWEYDLWAFFWRPNGPSFKEQAEYRRVTAMFLGQELTYRLRNFGHRDAVGTECHHIEEWPGGASLGEDLDVRSLYNTAQALNRLLNDETQIQGEPGIASFHEVYRDGIVEGAVARAPELKRAWLKAGQDHWTDSAAILYRFVTDDRVSAERLGLDAVQVAKLQRLHDVH